MEQGIENLSAEQLRELVREKQNQLISFEHSRQIQAR